MISLNRHHFLPIGLHLAPGSAMLLQLSGPPGRWDVHAMACGAIPEGGDAPPEQRDREIAAALRKLLLDHPFKGRRAVSCLGADDLFVQNVRLPELPDEEVEQVLRFEADERLPYPVEEAEIRHLRAGTIRQDSNTKEEVILLACRRDAVERHVRILEWAGLNPAAIDIEACAALRCLRQADSDEAAGEPGTRRAYLNLGYDATTVMFAEGDEILFLKEVATGGRELDAAVAQHLELEGSEAASMRHSVMTAPELDAENEIHRSVAEAIRHPLEGIASEVELCLRYHKVTFRGKPLDGMVVTGREAGSWLVEYFAERLATPCRLGDPFAALARRPSLQTDEAENPWQWTTAMGLSMRPARSEAGKQHA